MSVPATESEVQTENANIDTGNANVRDVSAEIDSAIDALIASSDLPEDEPETKPETAAEPGTKPDPTPAGAAPAASEGVPAAVTDAPATKVDPEPTRANDRLAAREAQVAEREGKLKEREKELATLGSRLRRGEFGDVFKALGLEEREVPLVIRAAMASQLPADKLPAQYKQIQAELAQDERYRSMIEPAVQEAKSAKEELAQYKAMVAEQQAAAEYHAGVEKYLSNGVAEDAPLFAKMLQSDRSEAMKRLYATVQADAQSKLAKGSGDVMTPAEAAKAVEAELTKISTLLGATNSTPKTKTVVARPSLSTKAVVPSRSPAAVKTDIPLEKFVDDWLRQNGFV